MCPPVPRSYTALAAVGIAVALTSTNLDSFERYASERVPADDCGGDALGPASPVETVLALSAVALVGYEVLTLLGRYVP